MAKLKSNRLKNQNLYTELLTLAIPIGLQNLLIALIGATDAIMLGRLTQDSVSAVSLANQISFVMNLFIGAVVSGGGVLISQYWGKEDIRMSKNLFCMIIKWSFGISAVFFALALFTPQMLMKIFTSDVALIEIGTKYLRAISFSYIFSGITQCYYLKMKIEGAASKSVLISVFTLIADVTIDFFLIYGRCGVPKLGAVGSAYSTVAVELIGLIWCIVHSRKRSNITVDIQGLIWFSAEAFKKYIKIVLPTLASSLAWGLSISMHSLIMGHLGTDATAAASIASVIQELITCVCKGISAGTGIIIGKLLGQNLFEKAKRYAGSFCKISIIVGFVNITLLCVIAPIATEFFILSAAAKHYLIVMLIFMCAYIFAFSVNTVVVCGIFPAGGDTKYDAVSVVIATWCIALPLAILGAFVFNWSVITVYILMCLDEIIKVPFLYPRYKKFIWLKNLTTVE